MSIVVTGATGHLGRLVVEDLLARGIPADRIVATGRDTDKLRDLRALGVRTEAADYSDAASLRRAFAGAERVLLVSGSEVGNRVDGHRNAISAAAEAGVGLLAYTSIANAGTSSIVLAADHQATERALRDSGVPFVVLRNSWYLENYTGQLPVYLQHDAVSGSAGDGQVSAAARADYAAAAAAVLTTDGHEGKTYELGGDAFTLADLAAAITDATGTAVTYVDLPEAEYTDLLVAAGLPAAYAAALADSDRGIARGDLLVAGTALSDLIGRPTTSLAEAVAKAADSLTVS